MKKFCGVTFGLFNPGKRYTDMPADSSNTNIPNSPQHQSFKGPCSPADESSSAPQKQQGRMHSTACIAGTVSPGVTAVTHTGLQQELLSPYHS